jgi:hypothetical protein
LLTLSLKVEKNRDGKLGKTEIYLDYLRSRMMTKEEYQKHCEAVMARRILDAA